MTNFVIRSMSATDYTPTQESTPYHIYLKPEAARDRAWWTQRLSEAQKFDTAEAAAAEMARAFPDPDKAGRQQVAPVDARGFPPFWERGAAAS